MMRAIAQNRCLMSALDLRVSYAPASVSFPAKLVSTVTDWLNMRATRKALGRISDRELDDIGLCRGDINRVARGH